MTAAAVWLVQRRSRQFMADPIGDLSAAEILYGLTDVHGSSLGYPARLQE